jgi:hypothetical protein
MAYAMGDRAGVSERGGQNFRDFFTDNFDASR